MSSSYCVFVAFLVYAGVAHAGDVSSRLRARISQEVSGGKQPMVLVDVMGRTGRGKLVAADDTGITVRTSQGKANLPWEKITPRQFLHIACKVLGRSKEDLTLLAEYSLASNLTNEASRLDGSLARKIEELQRETAAEAAAEAAPKPATRKAASGPAKKKRRQERFPTLGELVDDVRRTTKRDGTIGSALRELVNRARSILKRPLTRRAKTYEEVKEFGLGPDGRANTLDDEMRQVFALSMSDSRTNGRMARELPLLALAYRITGEEVFSKRLADQLAEMATWSPLQRPGWTCYKRGNKLPADGKDGSWLATGTGVRGIADAFEILPPGTLDTGLVERVHLLLRKEIAMIVDDWQSKRQWFVRSNNAITNQWVLPTEGLVRACLVLGKDEHRDAYELGVRNMLQAFDSHGSQGEFEEGFVYASGWTLPSMLSAARAMAAHGDFRCIEHVYLRKFPTWMVHHYQPGKRTINCFDAHGAAGTGHGGNRSFLCMLAVCTDDPVARWALAYQVGGPSNNLFGVLSRKLAPVGPDAAPPLFAYYERATRVNWRSSWQDDAVGVWIRGGHEMDQHDDADRGHVNFIVRGTPILIEAGTPCYHNPLKSSLYSNGIGHNVLQIGKSGLPKKRVAPITVHALGEEGGDITVDPTACYDGLKSWQRRVTWSASELTVKDTVVLSKPDTVLFRWHLGTEEEPRIQGKKGRFSVEWTEAVMTLKATALITVTVTKLPDHTITQRGWPSGKDVDHMHTCIVVQSATDVASLELTTAIRPK